MNTANNFSVESEDTRSIQRIIFEKANFGAAPMGFTLRNDTRLHPVQWTRDPDLESIQFSDGSIVHVHQELQTSVTNTTRPDLRTFVETDDKPSLTPELDAYIEGTDSKTENAIGDMGDELAALVQETTVKETVESKPVDDGMYTTLADSLKARKPLFAGPTETKK